MLKDMNFYHIGNTPMVELEPVHGNQLFLKLERENFLGSVKARTAFWMIQDLPPEADGKVLVESTSGNLGIALDYFCRATGRQLLCLVDESIAREKLHKLDDRQIPYEIVACADGLDLRSSRIKRAQELAATGEYYWVNQYDNPSAVKAHAITTGSEIWAQTQGAVTCCVCPMGSCGTICGISRYLKSRAPQVQICGAEPFGSTIFGTTDGPYINVGAGLVGKPGNLIHSGAVVDMSFTVRDEESIRCAQELYRSYQLAVGVTSGMAYAAALRLAEQTQDEVIVIIAPDGREAYGEYLGDDL